MEDEFNLIKLIDDFTSTVKPLMEEKEHDFVVNIHDVEHEEIIGDAEKIHQSLMNFVSNAIKYTPRGGQIKLSVTEKKTDRSTIGCYEFIVEDNGIGMNEDFVKVMFEPFTRADDKRALSQQGSGLGMSITQNIIKMMDGDIKVDSRLNEGTRITITVYLTFRDEDRNQSSSDVVSSNNGIQKFREYDFKDVNVLLVEDNKINAEIAAEILEMAGIHVEHAWNGSEAVEKLEGVADDYYKLVFMDIQMPVMNGYDATQKIRASERKYLKEIPIVAMSANAFAEDDEKSKAAGMNGHIAKPLNFDKLLEILTEYIS